MIEVKQYQPSDKVIWNEFVRNSKNGLFLFNRDYMDYHSDRFDDHSLLVYREKKIMAILPANIVNSTLYSHQGLTYGGLLLCRDSKITNTIEVVEGLVDYCRNSGITTVIYKVIPHIFHQFPAEEDLYALHLIGARLLKRSATVLQQPIEKLKATKGRKAMIARGKKEGIIVEESTDLESFYIMMTALLSEKYEAKPTHNIQEISRLRALFPKNIRLFNAKLGSKLLAGVIIFESEKVAHFQYISTTEKGRELGALDVLVDELLNNVYVKKSYLDFGTSNDDGSYGINETLIKNKESYGGRSIMQDVYEISI